MDTPEITNPLFSERSDTPTPNGGAYSVAYFYDDDYNPCEKSKATHIHILIFNSNDEQINAVYI